MNFKNTENGTINLFEVGCLINLRVGIWSGRKMLTRADMIKIGYDPDKLPDEICNLGRKLLVPKSELQALNQIEQRARKALERWSVPFGIANSHFVPITMLPTVESQIDDIKNEFFERVDSFMARFDAMVSVVRESHPDFWDKCLKGNYPSNPKMLRDKFQFDWYTFRIAGIESITKTSTSELLAEHHAEEEKAQEVKKQMQDEVSKFVGEYVGSMRDEVVRFCDLMTARINGKPYGDEDDVKKLTPRSIACFRKYVDKFRSMNIFGDNEIEKMLSDFKSTFLDSGVTPKDFDPSGIKTSISKSLEAIRNQAAVEGENRSKFIGELKRRVVL